MKMVITRMSYFFNRITQKAIDETELPVVKAFIAETLCQLEICFRPSYFVIVLHLVDQLQELSPVYLYQMWAYSMIDRRGRELPPQLHPRRKSDWAVRPSA